MMRNFYASLWDRYGSEVSFPGYSRQLVQMDVYAGKCLSTNVLSWSVQGAVSTPITTVKLHEQPYSPPLLDITLSTPVAALQSGDTLTINHGGLSVTTDGMAHSMFTRHGTHQASLEDFLEENPTATNQDIWEAAFTAGHAAAYTLLTGEAE